MVNKAFIETMIEGRRERTRLPVPDPDLFHHQGLRLVGDRKQPPAVRDDREIRHALFLQLHQQRYGAPRTSAACAAGCVWTCASCAKKRRLLRQRRAHRLGRRGDDQYAAHRRSPKTEGRLLPAAGQDDGHFRPLAEDQAHGHLQADGGGAYPTKRYLGTFDNHFSTIGLVGHERSVPERQVAARGYDRRAGAGVHQGRSQPHARAPVRLSGAVRRPLQPGGDSGGIDGLPSRQARRRALPRHHHRHHRHRQRALLHHNSSHLPVGYTEDIFEALDIQDELQTLYTSGTVFHAFLGEKLPDWKSTANWSARSRELQAALLHHLPDLFHLPHARLHRASTTCPTCGASRRGLFPHHGLLPPRAELERRQSAPSSTTAICTTSTTPSTRT